MKYLLLLSLAALASCSTPRETIQYSAVKYKCSYPDGFGMDRQGSTCDSGTVTVRKSEIIRRSPNTITVQVGDCKYKYLLTKPTAQP